ncbi:hypothetical protein GTQ99_23160, partial [Kineococcus sp. T13]|uniref:hypothetical protein n=1 Tax=Kineococcus vitellinus TaxID=2696565 RepID=UPI00196B77B0
APASAPVPAPSAAGALVREDADGQLLLDLAPPAPPLDEAEVERMLTALARADERGVRGLGSRRAKVAVAVGGGAGLTALLLAAMTALGALAG